MFITPPLSAIALLLDIDGTLLDFAPHPEQVLVTPELIRILQDLCERLDGALGFISGRTRTSVDQLFSPLVLAGAYQHGTELRFPDNTIVSFAPPPEHLNVARNAAEAWCGALKGVLLEDKGSSLAIHYRNAAHLGDAVRSFASDLELSLGSEFNVLHGNAVVEIKPAGRDKGKAVQELMRFPAWQKRKPVFVGDDVTDEYGFKAVNECGGISVKVGQGNTCAHHRLPDPGAVRDWLKQLLANPAAR